MQLTFLGATGTVTGSKYHLQIGNQQLLIDCGLFQGYKELRLRNWAELPLNPHDIDAVLLTHAHIDHSGYLPRLVKQGFSGPIYSTKATKELCALLLPDSGYIQEEDARRANKYHYTKHHPALPLYTKVDALEVIKQFKTLEYNKYHTINDELSFRFQRAGHILGSSFITIKEKYKTLLFTGDMGRPHDPIIKPPTIIKEIDYLVVESTYGNRLHDTESPEDKIADIINKTAKRGGTVIIPAFAVGRAQTLLYYLYNIIEAKKIPRLPVYLDSPMAINATEIMCGNSNEQKLSSELCKNICNIATYVNSVEDSKALDRKPMPKIIISASGMASGGRVLHHLKALMSDHKNTILFTGFQAGGTRGDRIMNGETEIKMFGQMIPVNAQIESLSNTSAHADYQEILDWMANFTKPPRKVFITHGELVSAEALKEKIEKTLGWDCVIPTYQQSETL